MVIPGMKWSTFLGLVLILLTYTFGCFGIETEDINTLSLDPTEEKDIPSSGYIDSTREDAIDLNADEKEKLALQALEQLLEHNYASRYNSMTEEQKRMSPSGFYGSRGKKGAPLPNAFYGSRGKKSNQPPMMSGFYGSRGRKRRSSFNRFSRSNDDNLFYANGKRIDPDTFFGMRGKRTQEEYNPLSLRQEQYYKTIPSQINYAAAIGGIDDDDDIGLGNNYYFRDEPEEGGNNMLSNFNGDLASLLSSVHDGEISDEVRERERLKQLLSYYNSLRSQRVPMSPYKSLSAKVKRQPPTGFHAIRGR